MIFCILRSGGDAKVIQFLDSGLEWLVGLPCAFLCVKVLGMTNIAVVLLITQLEQLIRLIFGMKRVRSYQWANDLTQLV
jgi:Na+-driven multidrug efflux pump